jgi:hypothetical protein
VVAEW